MFGVCSCVVWYIAAGFPHRADETVETMRKEHTSRMTVERAKALKMKMEMDNLEKAFKQKVCIMVAEGRAPHTLLHLL